jgi:hypothetical protein
MVTDDWLCLVLIVEGMIFIGDEEILLTGRLGYRQVIF